MAMGTTCAGLFDGLSWFLHRHGAIGRHLHNICGLRLGHHHLLCRHIYRHNVARPTAQGQKDQHQGYQNTTFQARHVPMIRRYTKSSICPAGEWVVP